MKKEQPWWWWRNDGGSFWRRFHGGQAWDIWTKEVQVVKNSVQEAIVSLQFAESSNGGSMLHCSSLLQLRMVIVLLHFPNCFQHFSYFFPSDHSENNMGSSEKKKKTPLDHSVRDRAGPNTKQYKDFGPKENKGFRSKSKKWERCRCSLCFDFKRKCKTW